MFRPAKQGKETAIIWRENIDYRNSSEEEETVHYFDIAFVVDVSGSMRGNNIRNAKTALDIFEERENDRKKIVVLLCDGDVNYNQRTIDRYKEAGIQIYAVNVESNSAHRDLQKMASQTNGQYFYGDSNELDKIFGQIQDVTVGRIDPTDGDGIEDKEDAAPWIADYLEGHLENAYFNTSNFEAKKYVRVQKYDSVDCLNGGNQNWWQMKFNLEEKKGMEDFKSIMEIPEYRMWHLGCGVVAMTDMELFLTQQNEGYKAPLQDIAYDKETGIISNDDYMKYAEYNRDNIYYLGGNYVNKLIGVLPGSMEAGLAYYLRTNNHLYTNVKWAPYSEMFRYAKNQTALTIEDMIDRNIPVVFSYHTFDKNEYLHLYRNIASARAMNMKDYERTVSHYMTIVGYQKYIDDTSMDYHYILKVVSWGEVYYVNYDEYMQKLSYVTNILSVGG